MLFLLLNEKWTSDIQTYSAGFGMWGGRNTISVVGERVKEALVFDFMSFPAGDKNGQARWKCTLQGVGCEAVGELIGSA